jgi:hypothetical protein
MKPILSIIPIPGPTYSRLSHTYSYSYQQFPIIPSIAFCIREVGQPRQYISGKFLILFVAKAV